MIVKAFEIRDARTFIPVIAIKMVPTQQSPFLEEQERYLLARAGYGIDPSKNPLVVVCRMEAAGIDRNATYDPYSWGNRTMNIAHLHIEQHIDVLSSGDVIDVEFVLGEKPWPKISERMRDITQPKPPQ